MPEPVIGVQEEGGNDNQGANKGNKDGEDAEKESENEVADTKTAAVHDAMRNEPILTNLIIESYEGEKDDRGFFHGVGTAYFRGGHVYTGSFVNGKMDGTGKYVWASGIMYEGDFKENKIEGKGLYTWSDGSTYEGEVLNGFRHGQGTYSCGCLPSVYIGEWKRGKRHGRGVLKYDEEGRSEYDGHWLKNARHGHGVRRYASGNAYEGDWKNNLRHGDGIMHWCNGEQVQKYNGQWEGGIQHGYGEHSWYLKRIHGSQYPLRNHYVGEWCNGLRHGYGTFTYASGAKYIGEWLTNMKHGKGKYAFQNGHVFDGKCTFEQDHMLEYPEFNPSGMTTPDIINSGIPVRPATPVRAATPFLPMDSSASSLGIHNPLSIRIDHLLDDLEMNLDERQEELQNVTHVILRHVSKLKQIYCFYSGLGQLLSTDNTFALTRMQFWRFLKDCQMHYHGVTLVEMDRFIDPYGRSTDIHEPYHKVLSRDFINAIIIIAFNIFHNQFHNKGLIFAECTSKLISDNILPNACDIQGVLFTEATRADEASKYVQKSWDIFIGKCHPSPCSPHEPTFKAREFLYMLNEFKLLNDILTPKDVIQILSRDSPHLAQEDFCNLELEMTFLEFFEGLIDCAGVYVTDTMIIGTQSGKISPEQSIRSRSVECLTSMTSKPEESPVEDGDNAEGSPNASPVGSSADRSQHGTIESTESHTKTRESHTKEEKMRVNNARERP
ncbi:hypothetical protein QZH41_019631 [Actinostola sp. cb2023]|nr:hypothetical protein QZH41_019631 [Actinostola sp. cb2023]